MGAYLHLRGLAEVDDISESNTDRERFHFVNELGTGVLEVATTDSAKEDNYTAATNEMNNDCSDFWAGQLDDIFEELQVKNSTKAMVKLSSSGQEEGVKIPRELGLECKLEGEFGSGKRESLRNACIVEKRISEDSMTGDAASSSSSSSTSNAELLGKGDKGSALTDGHNSMIGGLEELACSTAHNQRGSCAALEDESERLPDHLLIELLVRVPTQDWPAVASVKKRWAQLFKGDGLWQSALVKKWPGATSTKRWPGPIARGSSKRRYTALYISDSLFAKDKVEGVNEVAGHVYLFLKEQLESSTPPVSYGLLHGTIIDQFLACCKTGDEAYDLASHIWIAVLDNLDESENTFHLLMRIAEEWEIFLPYPYLKSQAVQWRVFERLFTDFRDCLSQYNYFDVLTRARSKFELIPQTWLGY